MDTDPDTDSVTSSDTASKWIRHGRSSDSGYRVSVTLQERTQTRTQTRNVTLIQKMTWTKLSDPVSEYFDVLKLPSHVFPGPLIYALPLKLNLYFNLIEFEIDFHTSAPPKFRIFERSKSPPSRNFNFIKFSFF